MTGHPNDQADGFFDDGDDWARRQALGAYNDTWDFLFKLERHSGQKDWHAVRSDLANFKGDLPYHNFSDATFRAAAREGQIDILETMAAKNFRLPDDDAESLIGDLAVRHLPKAGDAIRFLLDHGCKGDQAVTGVAETGSAEMMEMLDRHGCNILLDGAAFELALHAGNAGVMKYLYDHGADIYTPAVVKGLHGGIEDWQKKYRDHAVGTPKLARTFHEALCHTDALRWEAYYFSVAPETPSLEDLRSRPDGVADKGITLLQLAARAGQIDGVFDSAARASRSFLTADDLLQSCEGGSSALTVLAARGEAHKIFDARLWWRSPEQPQKLYDSLKTLGVDAAVDPASFAAELQRYRLRISSPSAPRLKPRRP